MRSHFHDYNGFNRMELLECHRIFLNRILRVRKLWQVGILGIKNGKIRGEQTVRLRVKPVLYSV